MIMFCGGLKTFGTAGIHTGSIPRIHCKNGVFGGFFLERLYRRAGARHSGLHYREQFDRAGDGEAVWGEQEYGT